MKLHLPLVVLALATLSCATTRLIDTYAPKAYGGPPFQRLMVVGLAPNQAARTQYENDFVDKLSNYNVLAIASVNLVPKLENVDKTTVEGWLAEYNLDGVLVTRATSTKPPRKYVPPHLELSEWYGAWAADTEMVAGDERFYLETDLFDAKTLELLYSAAISTAAKDRTKMIHAVIDKLAADMIKRGYFPSS